MLEKKYIAAIVVGVVLVVTLVVLLAIFLPGDKSDASSTQTTVPDARLEPSQNDSPISSIPIPVINLLRGENSAPEVVDDWIVNGFESSPFVGTDVVERKSSNHWYYDVLWYCPKMVGPKTFLSMLAVDKTSLHVVQSSNSFLLNKNANTQEYEDLHHMFEKIFNTYELLRDGGDNDEGLEIIEKKCVLFANAFSGTNSGHDLCLTLMNLHYLAELGLLNEEEVPIVLFRRSFRHPRILELIELLVPRRRWIVLEPDTKYLFKQVLIIKGDCRIIEDQDEVNRLPVQELIHLCIEHNGPARCVQLKNRKILLLKRQFHDCVNYHNAFSGERFFERALELGYMVINPETTDMRDIVVMLHQCSEVYISYGAIMYTHMHFINPNAQTIQFWTTNRIEKQWYGPFKDNPKYEVKFLRSLDLDSQLHLLNLN